MCVLLGITDYNIFYGNLKKQVYEKVGCDANRVNAIEELGLLSEELVVKQNNPIDTISKYSLLFSLVWHFMRLPILTII